MDYRNSKDEQNNKDFGFGSLMEMLKHRGDKDQQNQQFQQNLQAEGQRQQAGFQQQKDMLPLQTQATLETKKGEAGISADTQAKNLATLQDLMSHRKPGEKTSYDLEAGGGVKTMESQPNPVLMMSSHLGQEGQRVANLAGKAFKPIQDQAEAAEQTLKSLNQGNSAADKAAVINEANMFLKGGGGRAMGAVMQQLTGEPTAEGAMQKAQNWLMNSSNIPTLQPAQRNSLREAVLGRVQGLQKQHQQVSSTLPTQARSVAPFTSAQGGLNDLVESYGQGAKSTLDRLNQMSQEYEQQKQQAQAPVSNPQSFNAQPTTLDKLKSFFTGGGKDTQSHQQPQQQAPPNKPPMSFEEFKAKRAAGQL